MHVLHACNTTSADTLERRIVSLVFWCICSVLHAAVVCLYLVANHRHSVGSTNGLKYWQLQRPMFIVAICAATTGLAASACYLYVFATDTSGDTFFRGFSSGGFASSPFIALLIFQPLEFFTSATPPPPTPSM